MDLAARRELNNGFGDTLARSFEFAVTPTVFAAFGYWLDGRVGTTLVFTIGLLVLALAGTMIRWYYDYDQRMRALDDERVTRRNSAKQDVPPTPATVADLAGGTLPTGVSLESTVRRQDDRS